MENTKVDILKLSDSIVQKLHAASIKTLKDLLSKSEIDLIKILNTSYPKVKEVIETSLMNITDFKPLTSLEIFNKESNLNAELSDKFSKIVFETGILKERMICEVCGPPGCGKTQLSMQLCSQSFFNNKYRNNHISIAYIDTENNLSARRLVSIAKTKFPYKSEDEINEMTKNIYVYSISTVNDLEKAINRAECKIILNNLKLIVIDSLAALVRREFTDKDSKTSIERAKFLVSLSVRLKEIAHVFDISVLIVNQITVSYNTNSLTHDLIDLKLKESEKCVGANNTEDEPENLKINFDDAKILPALGYTWSHFVNIRIGLQYVDDNEREFTVLKSPCSPNIIYRYFINENGLDFTDYKKIYDGEDLTSQNIKTKPFCEAKENI